MSADGRRVAAGAPYKDDDTAGYVRVYEWAGAAWVQMGADISGETADDQSGLKAPSMSADRMRVAVGAHAHAGGGTNAKHVRVFGWNGVAWAPL